MFVRNANCGFFCFLGQFVYYTEQLSPNDNLYYPWLSAGNQRVNSDPVVAQNADGRLEIFARSGFPSFIGNIVHNSQTSPSSFFSYTGWSSLARPPSSNLVGKPAIGMNLDGRLDVFAVDSRGNVYHNPQSNSGSTQYAGWSLIGGGKIGDPTVALDADRKLNVFVHGLNDNLLYEKIQAAPNSDTSSDNWIPLGGN